MTLIDLLVVLVYLALVAFAGVPVSAFSLLVLVLVLCVLRFLLGERLRQPPRVP